VIGTDGDAHQSVVAGESAKTHASSLQSES